MGALTEVLAVVPTLGAPALETALASLRRQGATVEIVVVHQGPGAPPRAAVTFADQIVELPRAVGFARAINAGLAAREARLALLLNDDAELLPGWLDTVRAALDAEPHAAAAQGVDLATASGPASGCGIGWNRWWQAVQLGIGAPPPAGAPREIFGVSAAAALFRLDALRAAARPDGVLDATLDTYYEDVDLAARLRARGTTALVVPEARALHGGGGTAAALAGRRQRLLRGNRWLVLARLLGRRLPWVVPRAVARDLADLARHPWLAPGVAGGWARALRLLPRFARLGPPLVPMAELRRLSAEAFA